MLATILHPASQGASAPPLVIAHGLYGSARNWGVIARRLADIRNVVTVDMRNHGTSPRFATQSYPEMAADLAEVIASLGTPVDLLGHSMGGKAAMHLMGDWDYQVAKDNSASKNGIADDQLGILPFPTIEGGKGDPASALAGRARAN